MIELKVQQTTMVCREEPTVEKVFFDEIQFSSQRSRCNYSDDQIIFREMSTKFFNRLKHSDKRQADIVI